MTHCRQAGVVLAFAAAVALIGCATGTRTAKSSWTHKAQLNQLDPQMESHARYADGVIAEMSGDLQGAIDSFSAAVAKSPQDEDLVLDVARRFLQYRQPQRALDMLSNAVARPHISGELDAQLAQVYTQLGQAALALKANEAAVHKSPTLLSAQQGLYLGYLQAKREDQARQALEAAAATPDGDADFLIGIAELYSNFGIVLPAQRTNANARARGLLERAASLNPTNTQTCLKLADGLNQLGETSRAAELYRLTLERSDLPPQVQGAVRAKLADLYLRVGDHKQAAELLEGILKDDPLNAQASFILGSMAYDEQRAEQAIEHFNRTVLLNPKFEQAYYNLASAQIAANKLNDALATLENARSRFPQSFFVEYLSGVTYSRRKDYKEALKHYTAAEVVAKATQPHRLTHFFYFQLGVACERSGEFDTAARHFEKCLELAPNFADAQNYLGYMWAERGVNLERARELIEQAVQAEPDNGAFLDSLGWVLFKLGKPLEALVLMERALDKIEEPDPTLYDHLGDIHAALGEMDKAREAWRKSLEIEPNDNTRKKLDDATPK